MKKVFGIIVLSVLLVGNASFGNVNVEKTADTVIKASTVVLAGALLVKYGPSTLKGAKDYIAKKLK